MVYDVQELRTDWPAACINGRWVVARPVNFQCQTIWERLREAWGVFRGRYDAIRWPSGQ